MVTSSSPFGGQARTRVLLGLRLLDESYPSRARAGARVARERRADGRAGPRTRRPGGRPPGRPHEADSPEPTLLRAGGAAAVPAEACQRRREPPEPDRPAATPAARRRQTSLTRRCRSRGNQRSATLLP